MSVHVQFSDESKTNILSVFGGPQPDGYFDNLGEVEESDSRYLAFLDAVATPEPTAADVIAATRYGHETAGITVSGVPIDTGRDSQALIAGAALSAVIDNTYVCTWKTVNGPVSLTATQLIGIATAVRAHVQACFDRESVLLAAVADKTYTDAMLAEGWPALASS